MGSGEDPFDLMKQMTASMKQTSAPINFSSYMPGGANFKQPSLNSYAALAKQKRDGVGADFDGGSSVSAIGGSVASGLQAMRRGKDASLS